jgi:PAS domain S-box-containing protein
VFKEQSISRKLTWMNLAVSGAALLLACLAFLAYDQVTVRSNIIHNLSSQAEIVGLNSVSAIIFNDPESATRTLSALQSSPNILAAAIYTADGNEFASYSRSATDRIASPPVLQGANKESHSYDGGRVLLAQSVEFGGKRLGTVYIRAELSELQRRLRQYLQISFVVLLLSMIAALLTSAAFRRSVAGPVIGLAETARAVSRDRNFAIRAKPTGTKDEVAVLIDSFNEMLSQIQARDTALETERARLQTVIDNVPVGMIFAEAPSGRIVMGNRQVEEILRYPMLATPDLPSYDKWMAFHPDGHRLAAQEFPLFRAIRTGEIVRGEEYLFRRGDDSFAWMRSSAAPIRDKEGKIVAGVLAFMDVDDAKRAEQKLRQAHDRLAIALTTAKMADWEWDLINDRVVLSPSAERLHGMLPGSFDGRFETWIQSISPDDQDRVRQSIRLSIETGIDHEADYRTKASDGGARWLLSKAVVQREDHGMKQRLLGVSMDITTLKQAQEALLQSEKLAAAGRLAASISHEINNPLESITNLLFLVSGDPALPEALRTFVEQAEQELARVSHIATQTLRFYRQSTKPTSADISALLDSVLALHRGRFANMQVEVVRQYRTNAPLLCFEGELRQVFTNLVGNALDAMFGRNGRLLLRTSARREWRTGQKGIRVTICDNGSGIPPEVLARIFEPFYSTKGMRGTGLGLWVSKEIIAKHKGLVKVRSKVGKGTIFSLFFPFDGLAEKASRSDSAIAS